MRIISPKFKDYYDMVAGQGVDLTRIYMRETKEVPGGLPLPDWNERENSWGNKHFKYPRYDRDVYRRGWSNPTYNLSYIYVLFAGKLYGGIALKNQQFGNVGEMSYYWDADSWKSKAEEIGWKGDNRAYYGKNKSTEMDESLRVFTIVGDEVLSDWAIDNKLSIAVSCGFYENRERGEWFVVDANLKDLNFQKVLDPFTAYQELDQWIGGVLCNKEVIPEMTDKDKITSHGFDSWSFRKHKDDNK